VTGLQPIPLWVTACFLATIGIATAIAIERIGVRRALPAFAIGFILLALISLSLSWFVAINIGFVPVVLAATIAVLVVQGKKLWFRDIKLTQQLKNSASKLGSLEVADAHSRLLSGLKLIETVLHPQEAIVFRIDGTGQLSSAARLRSSNSGPLETSRNSKWRDGVTLCERAIKTNSIVDQKSEAARGSISLAIPLRHESRTVGALLIRMGNEFDDNDRVLLSAVAAQMARNLQREEALKSGQRRRTLSFISSRAAADKIESLYVLNGLLTEQQFGVSALSELTEGLALAYLDGTLAYANPAFLKYIESGNGTSRTIDLLSLLQGFRTDVFDEPSIAVRRVLQTGEPYERELNFPDRGITCGLRISLIRSLGASEKGEPLCLAIHLKDVTRLKEHEQLKSDMISLMSHELRTPITSINGFAELLSADTQLPDSAKEFVTIIANESQRLSRMINTFLAVSRLQRKDKQEVLKIPLRLDEVAREIVMSLQPVAKKRRIRLVEQPAQRLPPVAADRSLISQAVNHLVSNAIKYSPERTTVTVTTALEAEAVRVSVEDRGFGIPAEARDRIWEKFYRVVRDGQEKDDESTGLGLSFVREVVEQHGGEVKLESEEGRGSKFSFTLPRL
jgi:two-component system phosphate regulon sensor histidine kinase PhoR